MTENKDDNKNKYVPERRMIKEGEEKGPKPQIVTGNPNNKKDDNKDKDDK